MPAPAALAAAVVRYAVPLSLAAQLGLLAYGAHVDAHPERFGGLRYTDVDWGVVADGLAHMASGAPQVRAEGWLVRSLGLPVGSATFRYTPLLPLLVSPAFVHPVLGKLVLVLATLAVPYLVLYPSGQPADASPPDASSGQAAAAPAAPAAPASPAPAPLHPRQPSPLLTHLSWTLNPLVLQITTRGSPESLVCLLVAAVHLCLRRAGLASDGAGTPDARARRRWADAAAIALATAASYKLFPAVFAVPVYAALARRDGAWLGPGVRRFAAVGLAATLVINGLLWSIWGQEYLDHTFLYHLTRKDHRHNFSPYFLPIYLSFFPASPAGARPVASLLPAPLAPLAAPLDALLGTRAAAAVLAAGRSPLASFLPQTSLVVLAGALETRLGVAPAMFVQTAAFIVFNKVCTSQYFLWPLPLLPHLHPALSSARLAALVALWAAAQAAWLAVAYRLEFLGEAVHVPLWAAGLALFGASVWALGEVVDGLRRGGARGRGGGKAKAE